MPVRVTLADEISKEVFFFFLFLIIIFSWVLIDLWCKWLNNFTYVTLGLDENSSVHTFIIALVVTCIILTCIAFVRTYGIDYRVAIMGASDVDGVFSDENPPVNATTENSSTDEYNNYISNLWKYGNPELYSGKKLSTITPIDAVAMYSLI